MSFWGVVVKPGKPVTLPGGNGGKLRISRAVLGNGKENDRTIVECKMGEKRKGVFVCALVPNKKESCRLELELNEKRDVVFSVLGPRKVHLSGYYINLPITHNDTHSESVGQDSELSTYSSSSSSYYTGSFIDNNEAFLTRSNVEAALDQDNLPLPNDDDEMRMKPIQKKRKKSVKSRTLANGVRIQELERGPRNGKVATLGKNVKIYYVGRYQGTRKIIHTNFGKHAFTFRLDADNDFIRGMSAGMEGMRVGDTRRLIFPPSLCYEDYEEEDEYSSDSSIIYEIELVGA